MVSGWKSIMGNPDPGRKSRSKKNKKSFIDMKELDRMSQVKRGR
jgi:hypothetical protein